MIEIRHLTKRYGRLVAVDDLTFRVEPGAVTGFLGPNGAGKSTTLRAIVGLAAPSSGVALVGGRRYAEHRHPLRVVGTLLDANAVDGARSGRDHLRWVARSQRIDGRRVDELLRLVGLEGAERRWIRTYSLGMRQRLGIAVALLGDPATLLLDEPMNGLDPEGVRWVRTLLRSLATEGRTVLVSSHLLSEIAVTADRLVVIGRGRLLADTTTDAMVRAAGTGQPGAAPSPTALEDAYLALTSASALGDGASATTGADR